VLRNQPELLAVADAIAATQLAAPNAPNATVPRESRPEVNAPKRQQGDLDPSAEM